MDLQAQLALKGIKIQNLFPYDGGTMITYTYKWVTGMGDVRWDNGFALFSELTYVSGVDDYICRRILSNVERTRESLNGKKPEVL